jgi:hypothetical protein
VGALQEQRSTATHNSLHSLHTSPHTSLPHLPRFGADSGPMLCHPPLPSSIRFALVGRSICSESALTQHSDDDALHSQAALLGGLPVARSAGGRVEGHAHALRIDREVLRRTQAAGERRLACSAQKTAVVSGLRDREAVLLSPRLW